MRLSLLVPIPFQKLCQWAIAAGAAVTGRVVQTSQQINKRPLPGISAYIDVRASDINDEMNIA